MQCLPRAARVRQTAIECIANDRRPGMRQVNPDLVRSTRVQAALEQADTATVELTDSQATKQGASRAPRRAVNDRHPDPLHRVTADRLVETAAGIRDALNQRQVASAH